MCDNYDSWWFIDRRNDKSAKASSQISLRSGHGNSESDFAS